ncbi:MAG TPA: YitT family protein [Candidatus Onthovivens sp.]|nr:YitT family protein [Candidatus Onthovivens sp.]
MLNILKEKLTFKHLKKYTIQLFLILLGVLFVSFGSGIFLVPFSIISGGITGLSILIEGVTSISVDILALIFTWSFFVLGVLFLGFKFSLQTLIATIFYPIFLSLILRTDMGITLVNLLMPSGFSATLVEGIITLPADLVIDTGHLLLIGILGGAFVGIGCGITFIGGGSTGGVDVLAFILNKFLGFKTSISSFLIDGTIVLVGLIVSIANNQSSHFVAGLIGIITAFVCSLMIELIYVKNNGAIFIDIISSRKDEIIKFSTEVLDRSATIFKVEGGYSKENKHMIRIICSRNEYIKIKDGINNIDPGAFVIFGECSTVTGEGFSKSHSSKSNLFSDIKKAIKSRNEK